METNGLHRADPLKPDSNAAVTTIYGAGAPDVSKERLRHEWCYVSLAARIYALLYPTLLVAYRRGFPMLWQIRQMEGDF